MAPLADAGNAIRESIITPELGPARVVTGRAAGHLEASWGARFEPFDWLGARARAWASALTQLLPIWQMSNNTPVSGAGSPGGEGVPLTNLWTDRFCTICAKVAGYGCIRLDNGCVHDGRPNTQSHFGGPVLEYFSFRRVLETLADVSLNGKASLEGYTVEPHLVPGVHRARATLGAILDGWPASPETWRQSVSEAAQKRLIARSGLAWSPRIQAAVSVGTRIRITWPPLWNLIRFLAQRVPQFGASRECVWIAPRLIELDPVSGHYLLLVKHATGVIGPGWWLRLMLDALAPGWETASKVDPGKVRPQAAAS
jgi:hypothetical protein